MLDVARAGHRVEHALKIHEECTARAERLVRAWNRALELARHSSVVAASLPLLVGPGAS